MQAELGLNDPAFVLRRYWPVAAGIVLLGILWAGPLPEMSRRAFSPHMILHLGVAVLAAPLIAVGLARMDAVARHVPGTFAFAVLASALEMLVVWGWHAPAPHEAAARNETWFVAQQASFLFAGLAVWLVAFSGRTRARSAAGAFAMLLTFIHMAMLGVLLALAPEILYAPDVCLGAFGLDRLDDQRLGGTLMAVAGGTPFLVGGIVLAHRVLEGPD